MRWEEKWKPAHTKFVVVLVLLLVIILITSCGSTRGQMANDIPQMIELDQEFPELTPITADLSITEPAEATVEATRVSPPVPTTTTTPPVPTGLQGQPFAPEGLSDCDEFNFYRVQWGLPDRFSKLAWRESNCRNEDGVKTFCCHGYLQLYVSLFLKDHRMVGPFHACGIFSHHDVNSDNPLEKQKQLCGAKALYDEDGFAPWNL